MNGAGEGDGAFDAVGLGGATREQAGCRCDFEDEFVGEALVSDLAVGADSDGIENSLVQISARQRYCPTSPAQEERRVGPIGASGLDGFGEAESKAVGIECGGCHAGWLDPVDQT